LARHKISGVYLPLRSYLIALGLVAAAFVVRLVLAPLLGGQAVYVVFVLVVLFGAVRLGAGPAIAASLVSALAATYAFATPQYELAAGKLPNLLSFLVLCAAIVFFAWRVLEQREDFEDLKGREAKIASDARENRLIDAAQDFAIYELDRDGRILTWNKGAERLKGWKAEDIIGKPYNVLHTPESRATNAPGRELKIAAETGRFEEEAPRMRKDGTIFAAHVSLFPLRDEEGEVTGFVKVTRDISDRSKDGKAILESRRRMEGIVQSAMDAIITIDDEQRIVLFNPAAENIFGYSSDEVLGQPITMLIPKQYRGHHDEYVRRFFDSGVVNRKLESANPLLALRSNGEQFPIEASISQVTVGSERVGTIVLRDITERKMNEEARSLLAREVDHRAKNALAVAQALVGLTRAGTVKEFADAVRGRIESLGRAHSLLSRSQWRGAPLDQLIRDELHPYAKDSQLALSGPRMTCRADAVQSLSLLFHELATNAVKHGALSKERGRVAIEWRPDRESMMITWKEEGGPPVAAPKRNGFGTSLLNQVSRRQLNAGLDFDWDPRGLRLRIELPADLFTAGEGENAREAKSSSVEEALGNDGEDRRILIVEDEELVALELSTELSRLGWAIVGPASTLNGAQSLLSKNFDAAVLDVNLRGRSVYPLAEALAERDVPFVFCTGYEMADPEGRFPEVPVIRKPAHPATVSAALFDLLKARAQ
jgi:PAS domain S-box-containing protein